MKKSLAGKCALCGKPIKNKNNKACQSCRDKCEKNGHGGKNHRHIAQIMFGCFCTRCGKSWYDF